MSIGRTLVKNVLSLSVAEVVVRLLSAALGIYIARSFGVEMQGKLAFATAVTTFVFLFGDLGLTQLAIREIAKEKASTKSFASSVLWIQGLFAAVLMLLIWVAVSLWDLDPLTKTLILLFAAGVFPSALNMMYVFQAHEKMEYIAYSKVISQIAAVIVTLMGIVWWNSIIAVPIGQFVGLSLGAILIAFWLRRSLDLKIAVGRLSDMRRMVVLALPFFISAVAVQIYYSFDSILLHEWRSELEVGWYASAYKIVLLLMLFQTFLASVFYPLLSTSWHKQEDLYQKAISAWARISGMLAWPIVCGGVFLASQIIVLVYGTDYFPAAQPFSILILLPGIVSLNVVVGQSLLSAGQERHTTVAVVLGSIVNLLANILLIPHWGMVGAALTSVFAEVVVLVYLFHRYQKVIAQPILNLYLTKPLIACFFMSVVILLIRTRVALGITILCAGVTYALGLIILKAVQPSDLKFMKRSKQQVVG